VNRVIKDARRYTIVEAKDADGLVRQKKVMKKTDKVVWTEVVRDERWRTRGQDPQSGSRATS